MITSSVKALRNNRKWAIGLKKSPFIETSSFDQKVMLQVSQARDLPVVDKWMISLKNGPEMDSNTKKKILAKTEIDLFSFSTQNACQNEMHESSEQVRPYMTSYFNSILG